MNIIVGNRSFSTFEDAVKYCNDCDFSIECIQIKEA